ncbi:2Fe-2S iron-sulfur cluster-binding protein [Pseudoxanthobacter sp.]|uniref:2Fe-2S iron-sulfur cluster-binding protein n=1 Tax=Pseudoxanthobacter sp. TaxID=1925742 RepID=UPI002FDF61A9
MLNERGISVTQGPITFRWNGRPVAAAPGDTLAAALWRAGIRRTAATRKRHLPLGPSGSFVAGALAGVDGRPNVRLDRALVCEAVSGDGGPAATEQNTWPSPHFDLLRAARLLPARLLYGGFEHGRLVPRSPGLFARFERLLAFLAGVGEAAHIGTGPLPQGRRIAVDVLVVGGGPAGRAAANAAAADGASVALVSRSAEPGSFARAMGVALPPLDGRVQVFTRTEVFGLYRKGALVAAAPFDDEAGALVFDPGRTVLATGQHSVPPVVAGNHLPGVIDAHFALSLASEHGVRPGARVVVVGTGAEEAVAARLRGAGVNVVATAPVSTLTAIRGRNGVRAAVLNRTIACDCVVHAGPWRADPGLGFQAMAEGLGQLGTGFSEAAGVSLAGSAAQAPQAIALPLRLDPAAYVCPCMDVTVGEVLTRIAGGESDLEVLKRLTSCGMGPCQGFPCWEMLAAVVARAAPDAPQAVRRPSHRTPRRGLTVAQAAGLNGLVEPDQS